MAEDNLSPEELEELSYYDFMGYMDVPFARGTSGIKCAKLKSIHGIMFWWLKL